MHKLEEELKKWFVDEYKFKLIKKNTFCIDYNENLTVFLQFRRHTITGEMFVEFGLFFPKSNTSNKPKALDWLDCNIYTDIGVFNKDLKTIDIVSQSLVEQVKDEFALKFLPFFKSLSDKEYLKGNLLDLYEKNVLYSEFGSRNAFEDLLMYLDIKLDGNPNAICL